MTPMQQILLGVGAKKKTYVDDVFSTYLWTGSGSSRTITNNLNLSGDGGMTWIKNRTNSSREHVITDTIRGAGNTIRTNSDAGNHSDTNKLASFSSTGFGIGTDSYVNASTNQYSSWSFKRTKGFFDCVTWTGNATARTIAHSLGCVPGMIIVKRTNAAEDWTCYHRHLGGISQSGQYPAQQEFIDLNKTNMAQDSGGGGCWNNTAPTSTHFSLGTHARVNGNNDSYVAYLFAEGPSDSVDFDGTGDYITAGGHSDFGMSTGDFTIECWVKFDDSANRGVFQISSTGISSSGGGGDGLAFAHNGSNWHIYANGTSYNSSNTRTVGKWYHVAMCRSSGTTKVFVDGSQTHSFSDSTNYNGTKVAIGGYYNSSYLLKGNVSNFRVVKGTALYTSAFTPPTAALKAITNTKLLCCNTSSVKGSTVDVSQQIVISGDPQASSDYPSSFVDSKVFGDSEENVIKCGSYIGNGSSTGPIVDLGWEPQWILHKSSSVNGTAWHVFDCMRGVFSGSTDDAILVPNTDAAEADDTVIDITSTGFRLTTSAGGLNQNNGEYIYLAIRRSDGYVGKPAEAGTDVFTMDTGNGQTNIPNFDSNFPVDFQFHKNPASTDNILTTSRLTGTNYLTISTDYAESSWGNFVFDSNVGHTKGGSGSSYQSWMWKRHAGLDVVAYKGNGTAGHQISHSLNRTVDMMWIKKRDATDDWWVYHSGMVDNSGGGNPEDYAINLNKDTARTTSASPYWNGTAPTSTHFTLGSSDDVNQAGYQYLAMLFSSVDKISKAGYYNGSNSSQTITLGFQPRFLIVRNMGSTGGWYVIDSLRGTGSSGSKMLTLNSNSAQFNMTSSYFTFISTGFTITGTNQNWNAGGSTASNKYLYYAHA